MPELTKIKRSHMARGRRVCPWLCCLPCRGSELFEGLEISKEEELCRDYTGRFPVAPESLKGAEGDGWETARQMMARVSSGGKGAFKQIETTGYAGELREGRVLPAPQNKNRKRKREFRGISKTCKSLNFTKFSLFWNQRLKSVFPDNPFWEISGRICCWHSLPGLPDIPGIRRRRVPGDLPLAGRRISSRSSRRRCRRRSSTEESESR